MGTVELVGKDFEEDEARNMMVTSDRIVKTHKNYQFRVGQRAGTDPVPKDGSTGTRQCVRKTILHLPQPANRAWNEQFKCAAAVARASVVLRSRVCIRLPIFAIPVIKRAEEHVGSKDASRRAVIV